MGRDLNPTENAFGGDPEKMSSEGHVLSLIGHLRPQAPSKMGAPDAAPAENQRFSSGDKSRPLTWESRAITHSHKPMFMRRFIFINTRFAH